MSQIRPSMQNYSTLFMAGASEFRTITLTVRFSDFETKNRSHSLKNGISWIKRERRSASLSRRL